MLDLVSISFRDLVFSLNIYSMNECKRERSPPRSRPATPSLIQKKPSRKKAKQHHRANESPLTFIRSGIGLVEHRAKRSMDATFLGKNLGLVQLAYKAIEHTLYFTEESLACLNSQSGTHYRNLVYGLVPILDHEQFDTMAIRRVRTFFSSVSAVEEQHPLPEMTTSAEEEDDEREPSPIPLVAVPRMDPRTYSERSYVLRLSLAESPVAVISIQHAVEELLERCSFLRDPSTTWICRPERLHVLLATTDDPKISVEEKNCRKVLASTNSGPIVLRLHRFLWRRQGTLWVQWHCVQANIDRLRADLRIASGGRLDQAITGEPEEDPTLSRPFAIETLVMAVLSKPTKEEFLQLKSVTGEMQRMFEGVTCEFNKVVRVGQIHDRLDREALNGDEQVIFMQKRTLPTQHATFMDNLDFAAGLVKSSPSVGRIAFSFFLSTFAVAGVAAALVFRKYR